MFYVVVDHVLPGCKPYASVTLHITYRLQGYVLLGDGPFFKWDVNFLPGVGHILPDLGAFETGS